MVIYIIHVPFNNMIYIYNIKIYNDIAFQMHM